MHQENSGLPIVGILGIVGGLAVAGMAVAVFFVSAPMSSAPSGTSPAPVVTKTVSGSGSLADEQNEPKSDVAEPQSGEDEVDNTSLETSED